MIVDSQCHVSPVWYEPVESLIDQMDRCGVAQAVLVQMIGQTDNTYQQTCLRRFPARFASVVWIDPQSPGALAQIKHLAHDGASALRLRPTARSEGADPLAIWRAAETLGLAISCVGNSGSFAAPEFADLLGAVPHLPIVLEHLGGTSQPDVDDAARAMRQRVFELARFPNVHLKVPGLGELMVRHAPPPSQGTPFSTDTPQILLDALSHFGPQRLMWGSDFPPVSSREGYANALRYSQEALASCSKAQRAAIFGDVARQVFKLSVDH